MGSVYVPANTVEHLLSRPPPYVPVAPGTPAMAGAHVSATESAAATSGAGTAGSEVSFMAISDAAAFEIALLDDKAGEYTLHFLAAVVVAWLAVQLGIVLYVTCKRRGRDKQE